MRLLAIALTTLAVGCGTEQTSKTSIYNGSIDTDDHQVGVLIKGGKLGCTASVIGTRTVLSAGHCFDKNGSDNADELWLRLGSRNIKVTSVLVHPSYYEWYGRITHDVALLTLESAAGVTPAPLASVSPRGDEMVEMVGYGYDDINDKSSHDGTRRQGVNYLSSVETYKIHIQKPGDRDLSQVCRGDSGGPVYVYRNGQKVQIGIVSGTYDRVISSCNVTTYGARVDAYKDWILENSQGDAVFE